MIGFPQPSKNPKQLDPISFGCAYGQLKIKGQKVILSCAFGVDPRRPKLRRSWPQPWGEAMQMCDWKGGKLDGRGLDDFVVFDSDCGEWMAQALGRPCEGAMERALGMAEASIDFLAERYGAPHGDFAWLAWIAAGPMIPSVVDQAKIAKRLIWSQWEADQLSLCADGASARGGGRRL